MRSDDDVFCMTYVHLSQMSIVYVVKSKDSEDANELVAIGGGAIAVGGAVEMAEEAGSGRDKKVAHSRCH